MVCPKGGRSGQGGVSAPRPEPPQSLCDLCASVVRFSTAQALTAAATGDTMLILTRKVGEAIRIGDDIEVVITAVDQNKVKVGIRSPRHVPVFREELYRKIQEENRKASSIRADDLDDILSSLPAKTP